MYHKFEDAKFLLRSFFSGVLNAVFASEQHVEIICRKHKRKNYYEVLGVPSVASHLEIKKAGGIG